MALIKRGNMQFFRCDKCKQKEVRPRERGMNHVSIKAFDAIIIPPATVVMATQKHLCDDCVKLFEIWLATA